MVERQPRDSSRDLLEELEDGWATPPAPGASSVKAESARPSEETRESDKDKDHDDKDDVDALDEGWLDEFFPENDDDEDDEPEEEEPELPDERLDPQAFALAKKAREERAAK